ncbi:MAG: hypothetical protein JWL73_2288 [Actinomycetia bacterium]|nr:hypothetical protein [Actinomycetes bacterium]
MDGQQASKSLVPAPDGSLIPRGSGDRSVRPGFGPEQGSAPRSSHDGSHPAGFAVVRLAQLAQTLAGARSAVEVARAIARFAPDVLDAEFAAVAVIEGDHLRLLYNDAFDERIAERFVSIPRESRIPATAALEQDDIVVVPDRASLIDAYPDVVLALEQVGIDALACAPLRVSGRPPFGVLTIGWPGPHDLDADDRAFLEAMADLCAPSVARARVTDTLALRSIQLANLAQQLAAARSTADVAAIVASKVVTLVDAQAASVGIIDPVAGVLRVHHGPQVSARMVELYTNPPLEAPLLFTEVARTGQPMYLGNFEEYTRRFPETDPENERLGVGARAAVPLRDRNGASFGAVVFSWDHAVDFEGPVSSVLSTLGDLVGQTLERARLADAEHQLVHAFQQRMLTPIPAVSGLSVAGIYQPASEAIGMGGDWYEGIALDHDRLALIVGDVAGHGIDAVADMAHLRSILAALLRIGVPLERLIGCATDALGPDSAVTASAFVAIVDRPHGIIRYLLVGHPPPVLVVDGAATLLSEPRQPIIGVQSERSAIGSVPFPEGATLVVYTDGLVERRRESIQHGLEHLVVVVGEALEESHPRTAAHRILDGCLGDDPAEDDVAIVVLRSIPIPAVP